MVNASVQRQLTRINNFRVFGGLNCSQHCFVKNILNVQYVLFMTEQVNVTVFLASLRWPNPPQKLIIPNNLIHNSLFQTFSTRTKKHKRLYSSKPTI